MQIEKSNINPYAIDSIDILRVEITNDCHMQCIYCTPYKRKDITSISGGNVESICSFISALSKFSVKTIVISGFGEFTVSDGWSDIVKTAKETGARLSCLTTLSKAFTDDEIYAMSLFDDISISVDDIDVENFKRVRRGGDIRRIIYNMQRIKGQADLNLRPRPSFSWVMVCYHEMIPNMKKTVATAIASDVKHFELLGLFHRDNNERRLTSLLELSDKEFLEDFEKIHDSLDYSAKNGASVTVQSGFLDAITKQCNEILTGGRERIAEASSEALNVFVRYPSENETRDCVSPWKELVLSANGTTRGCCASPTESYGNWTGNSTDIVNGPVAQTLRQQLFLGDLSEECRLCRHVPPIAVSEFQRKIGALLAN